MRASGDFVKAVSDVMVFCLWAVQNALRWQIAAHSPDVGHLTAGPDLAHSMPEIEGFPMAQSYSAVQQLMQDELQDAVKESAGKLAGHTLQARLVCSTCTYCALWEYLMSWMERVVML